MSVAETVLLTQAMVAEGTRLRWSQRPVMDKHCVGGVPGNRTTLIVVPIIAALGLTIPKTSSRAITSPAGTADTMETLAPVALDVAAMRKVVDDEGGCIVWGGAVNLSPVDDILIRVERPLDLDGEAQLVASVISKKVAAGSSHALIDIPVGPTAKIRSEAAGHMLAGRLIEVGRALGLEVDVVLTDGARPVGRGIGPALEARDVLAVLRNEPDASNDLRERALLLAGRILELAGHAQPLQGGAMARAALADGRAWSKFQAIARAQGGMREPIVARQRHILEANVAGTIARIDSRRLSRVAKLAGAPRTGGAGVDLFANVGTQVSKGQPLYAVHAESPGELAYALDYAQRQTGIMEIAPSS
jgi:thymidine phosphorylase